MSRTVESTTPRQTTITVTKTTSQSSSQLGRFREIAFDSEGVKLGRSGPLTVACFLGIDCADTSDASCRTVAYVIDVQTVGSSAFIATFSDMLSNRDILKITFDCRADSDALFHQFGIKLTGVLDLQVYEQAVRLMNGAPLPSRSGSYLPFVKGMAFTAKKYIAESVMDNLGGSSDNVSASVGSSLR
jgi:hypothetical protein